MDKLNTVPLRYIKGIGPKRAEAFARYDVKSAEDLLYFFPRRYEDRTNFRRIRDLKEGENATIRVKVLVSGQRRSWRRRGFSITEAIVEDDTARLNCVWFNQPYLKEYLKPATDLILYGKVESYSGKLQMNNPEFEVVSAEADTKEGPEESLNIGRIVPIYPAVEGLGQRTLRRLIRQTIDKHISKLAEFLPYDIRSRNNLLNLAQSLINIHFPQDESRQKQAYRRLAFEEFFLFQLPLALRKLKRKEKPGISHKVEGALVDNFIKNLPFALTESQKRVIGEIKQDMASSQAMQRLLQGDVGSGKTVVASIASIMAIQGGYQVALMVPTEILAQQHYQKIRAQLEAGGSKLKDIHIGLLMSSIDKKEKEQRLKEIKQGKSNLVIGTHALLEEEVRFKSLGLVVIDEQHKFGVGQRALLPQKGANPDVLIMTATPIPRTLAITLYGDLDVSIINELPPGRQPVTTQWITGTKRNWLYGFIKEKVVSGQQVYVVYPLIEESYALDLLSAKKMYTEFKNNVFKDFKVGLIHGKLKPKEQDRMMSEFNSGKLQILIATTVLEVGIDVANASVMVIEHAERFGLSQLHQLRGRIGRGKVASFCILVSDVDSLEAKSRLEAMVNYSDGFRIAEEDLKIRGPGEFFGRRQHGLSGLKIANPLTQMQLLKRSREEAIKLLSSDPRLESRPNVLVKEKLLQRFPEYDKLIMVG